MLPTVIIFSSSKALKIAEGILQNLEKDKDTLIAHLWRKDFFGDNKATPIWTFFKKLFCYDFAILVMADDEIIKDDKSTGGTTFIPKDNVIFELGAVMARLGPQKTFIVAPNEPKVRMPGYFDDVKPLILEYDNKSAREGDYATATSAACLQIKQKMGVIDKFTFHSDLPAQGLAFGYTVNFVLPVYNGKETQDLTINKKQYKWTSDAGLTITIVIPDSIMGRTQADELMIRKSNCFNVPFKLNQQRDVSVYTLERESENDPLHVLDIPTTLLTSSDIVSRIETFWRVKDEKIKADEDKEFIHQLSEREILNFERMLNDVFATKNIKRDNVFIVRSGNLPAHIISLKNNKH